MTEILPSEPDNSQPSSSLVPYASQSSDVAIIKQVIAGKIASADTLEEIKEGLALGSELESQIEISKYN